MSANEKNKEEGLGDLRDVDFSGESAAEVESEELDPLEGLKAEAESNKDKYLRALADFENYKKRALKERSDLLKYEGSKILTDLLEVLDSLELALEHVDSDPEKLAEGVKMIHKMFIDTLGKWQVRGKSGLDKDFDPNTQSAISRVPAKEAAQIGKVISEFKKTFYYKDRLLRAGEVVVAVDSQENS